MIVLSSTWTEKCRHGKLIQPGRSADEISGAGDEGVAFAGREPGLAVGAVLGFAEVHLHLNVPGTEKKSARIVYWMKHELKT